MKNNECIGIGRIQESEQIILIMGHTEVMLSMEEARILRDGLCFQLGIPAKEEVEVFEDTSTLIREKRET